MAIREALQECVQHICRDAQTTPINSFVPMTFNAKKPRAAYPKARQPRFFLNGSSRNQDFVTTAWLSLVR